MSPCREAADRLDGMTGLSRLAGFFPGWIGKAWGSGSPFFMAKRRSGLYHA